MHKHGGRRRHLFPSRFAAPFFSLSSDPRFSPLSLSRSPSPSLSHPYGQPIAAGKQKRARSRPIASDVPPRYPRVYKAAARAIRPDTPNHATHGHPPTSPFARPPSRRSASSLPSVTRERRAIPGYNPLPLNPRAKQCVLRVVINKY